MPKKLDTLSSASRHPARDDESRQGFRASQIGRTCHATTRIRDVANVVPISLSKSDEFAIQLLLDPHVTALEFRTSLSFSGNEVPIAMFVADLDDGGRTAFDIIDERPYWDLDAEGLVLLALQEHKIRLVEIDHAAIDSEPRSTNTRRLWSFREHQVSTELRASIDRAFAVRQRLTIQSLTRIIGLRDPIPLIGALVSQGVLAIDPGQRVGPLSVVGRRSDRWPSARGLNWFRKTNQ